MSYQITISGHGVAPFHVRRVFEQAVHDLREVEQTKPDPGWAESYGRASFTVGDASGGDSGSVNWPEPKQELT